MARYESKNRVASVKIQDEKKEDDLLLNSMIGVDKVGRPFSYTVEMLQNEGATIVLDDLIGKKLTVSLKTSESGEPIRYFNGFISSIHYSGLSKYGMKAYTAIVVPRIYFLKKSWNTRIFRDKSVNEILDVVFKASVPPFGKGAKTSDISTHPKLEHCVQYRETDFAFVHRLMEEYGISYYFNHKDGDHEMVLLDTKGKRKSPSGVVAEKIKYSTNISDKDETIRRWERRNQIVTDTFEQADFNFSDTKKFPTIIPAKAEAKEKQGDFDVGSFKQFLYEPAFEEGVADPHDKLKPDKLKEEAEKIAAIRLGAFQAEKDLFYGESESRKVHAGYEFTLSDFKDDTKLNGPYYVIAMRHWIEVGGYGIHEDPSAKRYTCKLTAIPGDLEYYPVNITPKARIYGPQTATVVGKEKSDKKLIYTDKHGRIKVRFHWERDEERKAGDKVTEGPKDETSKSTKNLSCWVRVAQGWAGSKFGSFFLPRVGHEVIVEFLDGDPDRPIVTGSVYNSSNLPPYKLGGEKAHDTISTIKTENVSEKGEKAETAAYNEIRFEDKEKSEQIAIHAGRGMNIRVLGDQRTLVGHNVQLTIDGSGEKDFKDKGDDDKSGHRDVKIMKGNDQLTLATGSLLQEVQAGVHWFQVVKGDQTINIKAGNQKTNIGGDMHLKVKGKILISTEDELHIKSAKSIVVEATKAMSFKAGEDMTFAAGKKINIDSGDKLLAKGAKGIDLGGDSSSVVIGKTVGVDGGSGVTIDGSAIDLNAGKSKSATAPGKPLKITEAEFEETDNPMTKVGAPLLPNKNNKSKDISVGTLD